MPSTTRMLRLAVVVAVLCAPAARAAEDPGADISAADYDARMRDLDTQLRNIVNTPVDFCDPVAMDAHGRDYSKVYYEKWKLTRARENLHPLHQSASQSVRQAAQHAADTFADEGLLDDPPQIVEDYEAAMKRHDAKAAEALFARMTPWEQERAAESQHNHALTFSILTPMAEQGDVKAQRRLAILYSWESNFDQATITHAAAPVPRDDALAFKYAAQASSNGDEVTQELLARAYACGMGTPRDLVKAYAWFSLAVSQSALMLDTDEQPAELLRRRDFIAAQMSHDDIQRAKHLLMACHRSQYKACD